MTKTQLLKRLDELAKGQSNNAAQVIGHMKDIDDYNEFVATEAMLTVGSGIIDSLNNLSLILLELLPKEEQS